MVDSKIFALVLACTFAVGYGVDSTNYDLSRNRPSIGSGFGIKEIWDYLVGGAGYGNYYPGQYPGNYPSNYPQGPGVYPSGPGYPGQYGPAGPPGAHPGCPLCDSSVYSYCSRKQAHDSCCCDNPSFPGYGCRKTDCKFLYANSCEEYQLISNCCCVDLQKNSVDTPVVAPLI
uniref:Cuticle protein n=1 Tax=Bombyx mori TaxID=7091 RepID=A0A8R1WIF4_BOMMO|nr:uncharacterized protein LOC101741856 isoform X1 [Bombyx mori]